MRGDSLRGWVQLTAAQLGALGGATIANYKAGREKVQTSVRT